MVARPTIERPRTMPAADGTQASSRREQTSALGTRRVVAGALDLDTARLVSDALGFGRPSGSTVSFLVHNVDS